MLRSGSSGFGMHAQCSLNLEVAWALYHAQHSLAAQAVKRIRRLRSA